ncbi:MAG: class I SAM-dependent methyltransferase [Actinobacteria bacterium]|nr:class I SAM-dependent methyltransferase [Actinomycetota bacterium]
MQDDPEYLRATYEQRFSERELRDKRVLWQTLVDEVFQQYVPATGTVLDLGAGYCEFSNAVRAARRIAVDLNPDTARSADPEVEVLITSSDDLHAIGDDSVDTVFTSNFFEHLPTKQILLDTLAEAHRVVRPGGTIVVLMPNIRYLPGAYWDYLDHHLPLTHVSLVEALRLRGFEEFRVEPRFLPYTVKDSRFPVRAGLVRAYLRCRPAWRILGKQMLVVARSLPVQ